VKPSIPIHQAGGGKDMEMGMEVQVIAECLHGGDGGELSIRQIEPCAHPVAQALDADPEEVVEGLATFAEDAAQGPGHRKDELAVRNLEANIVGNPITQGADTALVAAGAEMPALAGECEQLLMAAVGALEAGKSGSEVAAAVELIDHGEGILA